LRYFNAAGADPDGDIGEHHNPETHLIPQVLRAARDETAVEIYGADYQTPDGTCVRDYVHVVDLADAHLLALEYLLAKRESCALNLANARGHSVNEVIAAAERVCGRTVKVKAAPRRPGDPPILVGSAKRARELLGWSARRSDLEVQIADAWKWLKSAR
jgi:UDP-glucose 4-epimerase